MADEQQLRDYLRRVTIELAEERQRLHSYRHEPIAIVGMGCRYPGGIESPRDLWEAVVTGRDGIAGFPADRGWDLESLYHPDPDQAGTSYVREGGFLDDPGKFDAGFFEVSPREALAMDPQQRLLLETSWEALEELGLDPASLHNTKTGVFVGVMYQDYGTGAGRGVRGLEGHLVAGAPPSVVSGRVAYVLGLEGPAVTLDTACSSSLVAMHLAAASLRAGECDFALAGGVTVLSTPNVFVGLSRQRGLAPDGRCKSFAEAADGVGWGEGVGVLVLERLSDAQRQGHPILATIRGSAVNQDGASNGLTAPNGPSQERVIRQALANARLTPQDIDAVEAHGTGTTLGDPIEAGALLATYGQDRDRPLKLGSIKSNIGHTQAAAGVAGVIKTVMAMREGLLPKTLHVDQPSSKVDWEAGEIELLTEAEPWEENGRPRRAAVSSFGISGTNAHLILEQAPEQEPLTQSPEAGDQKGGGARPLPGPIPLALSAKTQPALAEQASRLAAHLKANPELDPTDVAYSLIASRSSFEQRAVVVGQEREELLAGLSALARGEDGATIARGSAPSPQRPAFLFPGQGAQFPTMGKELYEASPTFAHHIEACEAALDPYVDWSLREVLTQDQDAWLDRLDIVQPALFAVMVSLARLWQQCGVTPAVLLGHSQGEIAAAHIAGALCLDDAALIVAKRAQAMTKIAGKGAMLSVSLKAKEAEDLLGPYAEQISIAAINGPASLVLSGEPKALKELKAALDKDGIRNQEVAVDYAAHSAQIDELREELEAAFSPISPKEAEIPMLSTLSGEQIEGKELDPSYWYRNLRHTVRLQPTLQSLFEQGHSALIEVSPHPVLSFPVQETIEAQGHSAIVLETLRRQEQGPKRFCLSLAQAHANGIEVDWDAFFQATAAKSVALPTYPFQRKRYWLSSQANAGNAGSLGLKDPDHPLLAAAIEDPQGEGITLTGRISLATHPWLGDHAVAGTVLLPGTAFVELALRAAQQAACELIEELTLQAPLILSEGQAAQLQVSVGSPDEQGSRELSIHSRPEGEDEDQSEWTCHATGVISQTAPALQAPQEAWPPEAAEPIETEFLYDRLAEAGFEYGAAFQGLSRAWKAGEQIYAEVSLPEEQAGQAERFGIHPALLDSAFHAALDIAVAMDGENKPILPFAWRRVRVTSPGAASLRVCLTPEDSASGLKAFDSNGDPVVSIESLFGRSIDPSQLQAAAVQRSLHRLQWTEAQPGESAPASIAILGEAEISSLEARPFADLDALAREVGDGAPSIVVADFRAASDGNLPAAATTVSARALALLQEWLTRDQLANSRLVVLTDGALATRDGEDPSLAVAPLAGLLRSAHSEYPGRVCHIDTDGAEASIEALLGALAIEDEPQLALRDGVALAPRLARVGAVADAQTARPIDPDSTVLITGGTGGLGAIVARHLASTHGARNLLLVSRRGSEAPGAAQLAAELEELGATVTVAACDVSDRDQVEALIDAIPKEHALGAVVHSAAVLDDGVLESLDGERLERVFAPKVDAAWHLHELTKGLDLCQFLLFSSATGVLGAAAQANYTAANTFLDALAAHRRANGLPATALAWGLWWQQSDAVRDLDEDEMARIAQQIRTRLGFAPMAVAQGLELLDVARSLEEPLLVPAALDGTALRAQAEEGTLPAIMRGLVQAPARGGGERGSLAAGLASIPEAERQDHVLDLVRTHVAAVLGHASAKAVEPDRAFKELGFDSLAAVELRNRLNGATGLRLAPTLAFDYPNAEDLAAHVLSQATAGGIASREVVVAARASEEPIAIVGVSCRFPGSVESPEQLWRLLAEGRDVVSGFPADRGWDLERLYDPDPDNRGTTYASGGGFLDDAAGFDRNFFGIGPGEALAIDPQQRLLLESSWQTLEGAGIDPSTLRGSRTGVFAGVMYQDYGNVDFGLAPGMSASAVSGRVAYSLGLEGPTMTVDTACSSSLVALHLASQALRQDECSLALAGGVTVFSTPGMLIFFSAQRGLSPDGRCKAFADAADGVGLAEGVGMLALERLSDAEREGHPILATIRGSAVNQDGASNGITAPNGPSQERVIRQALANARLTPQDIDAVEAHGTGTTLGDPIEAGALLATYGQERDRPLKLGSIKSNIGHTQAAAGVAGVIKTVMAMREGLLPKTLHIDQPSSKVDWEAGEIELLTEAEPWEANGRPRRAAVSSFGATGTNAHLILEQAPAVAEKEGDPPSAPLHGPIPLLLSSKDEPALRQAASRLAAHLRERPELDLTDVAYSLATTRAAFAHRAVALGTEPGELLDSLGSIASGSSSPEAIEARAREGKLAYLLSGQGSQRAGMGSELYEAYPAYRASLDEILEQLEPHLERPLKPVLFAAPGSAEAELLGNTAYAQPALFATEVALHRLLASWGLQPQLLAGHSIGEIAAAHIAGVLSLADACRLVAARGVLMGELPAGGAMVAIEASEAEAEEALTGREAELAIAAINGPGAVVVSGGEEAAEEIGAHFREQGRKAKRLDVSHAFHSPLMEPMLERFSAVAHELDYRQPRIPIVSGVSGRMLDPAQAIDPAYWVSQVRAPVRFADAVATLAEQGAQIFLEVGPGGVLTAMASACLGNGLEGEGERPATLTATLREGRPEPTALVAALAKAHASGADLDWDAFFAGTGAKRVPLPTYPFQRQRYWLDPALGSASLAAAGQASADHPLLGAVVALAGEDEWLFTGRLSRQAQSWLADHAVGGTVLLPGAAFVEMALAAGEQLEARMLEELIVQAPLFLPEQGAVQIQVKVAGPDPEGRREIAIHSRPEAGDEGGHDWSRNATGVLSPAPIETADVPGDWPPEGAEPIEVESLYDRLAEAGFEYGPAFQGLTAAWRLGDEVFAEASLGPERAQEAGGFAIHPALLDSAAHAVLDVALSAAAKEGEGLGLYLPFAWRGVRVSAPGAAALRVRIGLEDHRIVALDDAGAPALSIDSILGRTIESDQLQSALPRDRSLYRVEWPELSIQPGSPSRIAILGDGAPGLSGERYADLPALLKAIENGAPAPDAVVASAGCPAQESEDPLSAAQASAAQALALLQGWVAAEGLGQARLTLLTEGAVAVGEGEDVDLAIAPLWGLVRSAQTEHPGRFVLLDVDAAKESLQALAAAISAGEAEPQLALREGRLSTPRLARIRSGEASGARPIDPDSTVLITGAMGGLGALMARHLVSDHGARHLLLVSRRGEAADGAAEIGAELRDLGAEATFVACDVGDRDQLEALIDSIPAEHPLGAVYHLAGVIDDGVLESLDPERLQRVFEPKAEAAWHLHELTAELDLSQFVLFSSSGGLIGNPGQANYAAANVFLDALAVHRRARGLPAASMAWGGWAVGMALHRDLGLVDVTRHTRLGYALMPAERGLELFEAAMAVDEACPVPLELEQSSLRTMAASGLLPAILRGLVRAPTSHQRQGGLLAPKLAAMPATERRAAVIELVRGHTATVLGINSATDVEPDRAFQELGFDSLAAVELRNQLGAVTGMRLPPTLVFDYPSVTALADHLLAELAPGDGGDELDPAEVELREALARVPLARLREAGLLDALREVAGLGDGASSPSADGSLDSIDSMDIDDLVQQTLERAGADSAGVEE